MSVIIERIRKTRAGRAGLVVGGVAGGLLALDLIGFVATVYFSAELLKAAEAAGAQRHFWEMHDLLFENQPAFEDEDLVRYALALNLDARRLMNEVEGGVHAARVREDFRVGTRGGVNGTPTFFINGVRYDGAHGLAVLGTTSEANSLDLGERETVLEKLVKAGVPPLQLLPGTGTSSIGDTVRLTRHAVALGVRGVLLLPPFYYKGVSDEGLYAYVAEVIKRVGDKRLAIYLYNFPQMTTISCSGSNSWQRTGTRCIGMCVAPSR